MAPRFKVLPDRHTALCQGAVPWTFLSLFPLVLVSPVVVHSLCWEFQFDLQVTTVLDDGVTFVRHCDLIIDSHVPNKIGVNRSFAVQTSAL